MLKGIQKKCIIEEDYITILLLDPRDNYIYQDALGNIGNISLSEEGAMIIATNDYERKIEMLRDKLLYQAFKEIFGTEEVNPLSNEYYKSIQTMIQNGTLKSLGYKIEDERYLDEDFSLPHLKH